MSVASYVGSYRILLNDFLNATKDSATGDATRVNIRTSNA